LTVLFTLLSFIDELVFGLIKNITKTTKSETVWDNKKSTMVGNSLKQVICVTFAATLETFVLLKPLQ